MQIPDPVAGIEEKPTNPTHRQQGYQLLGRCLDRPKRKRRENLALRYMSALQESEGPAPFLEDRTHHADSGGDQSTTRVKSWDGNIVRPFGQDETTKLALETLLRMLAADSAAAGCDRYQFPTAIETLVGDRLTAAWHEAKSRLLPGHSPGCLS